MRMRMWILTACVAAGVAAQAQENKAPAGGVRLTDTALGGGSGSGSVLTRRFGGGNWMSAGMTVIGSNTDSDASGELAGFQVMEKTLVEKQRALEMDTLKLPPLAAGIKAALDAADAYRTALLANKDYAALAAERDALQKEQQQLWTAPVPAGDAAAAQERNQKNRDFGQKLNELNRRIVEFPATIPELAALQKKKQDAASAFAAAFQDPLNANKEYLELLKQLQTVRAVLQDIQSAMMFDRQKQPPAAGGNATFQLN